jgi:hypothetical protein
VPLVVPVEELTRLLSEGSVLPEAVSEALGISLSEVGDLYFGDMDEVRKSCIVEEEWDCHQEDCHYEAEREEAVKEEHCQEVHTMKTIHSEMMNSISIGVDVSEST